MNGHHWMKNCRWHLESMDQHSQAFIALKGFPWLWKARHRLMSIPLCLVHAYIGVQRWRWCQSGWLRFDLQVEISGGGRIDNDTRNIYIYGYSSAYGAAPHEVTAALIQRWYPMANITFAYKGYWACSEMLMRRHCCIPCMRRQGSLFCWLHRVLSDLSNCLLASLSDDLPTVRPELSQCLL